MNAESFTQSLKGKKQKFIKTKPFLLTDIPQEIWELVNSFYGPSCVDYATGSKWCTTCYYWNGPVFNKCFHCGSSLNKN